MYLIPLVTQQREKVQAAIPATAKQAAHRAQGRESGVSPGGLCGFWGRGLEVGRA